jgi:hypothetical protein
MRGVPLILDIEVWADVMPHGDAAERLTDAIHRAVCDAITAEKPREFTVSSRPREGRITRGVV